MAFRPSAFITILFVCFSMRVSFAETTSALKAKMVAVFAAFRELQPYLIDEREFFDRSSTRAVRRSVDTLTDLFDSIEREKLSLSQEVGFQTNLRLTAELLHDARNRLAEGKGQYALWRLRAVGNQCVVCHTRYESPLDFAAPGTDLAGLAPLARGEFLLATRQFALAKDAFFEAAMSPADGASSIDALRKWLLVYTRVHPEPSEALRQLEKVLQSGAPSAYDQEEIQGWIASLKEWQKEKSGKAKAPLAQAAELIERGTKRTQGLLTDTAAVDFLRGTALLHKLLDEKKVGGSERGKVLYLLGVAYSRLTLYFVNELPELFFEQCIRDYPNSAEARQAFRQYDQLVTFEYTGSAGTSLPAEARSRLLELHDLAYGVPHLDERI